MESDPCSRSMRVVLLALFALLLAVDSSALDSISDIPIPLEDLDVRSIALRAERSLRADRTYLRARVTVRSRQGSKERAFEFAAWTDRVERRSFIRILAPASEAGESLLDLPPNLWRYEPELTRTQKLLPSSLLEPWRGSDFALDDLVDSSSRLGDYEVRLLRVEASARDAVGSRSYVLEYRPRDGARVAWGKIVAWIEADAGAPLQREFYTATGEKIRTIRFGDFRDVAGHRVPHRWKATAPDRDGRESILEIRELRIEDGFDDRIFTSRNLEPNP